MNCKVFGHIVRYYGNEQNGKITDTIIMISPRSNKKREKREWKNIKPTHLNHKFYASKAWRDHRQAYIDNLTTRQQQQILNSDMDDWRKAVAIDQLPVCETCLRLFIVGAYDTLNPGSQLDHIIPVNPLNALQSNGWGEPFDNDNLQLLCRPHHSKKSGRDKKYIKKHFDEKKEDNI